jgi:hypothetical protein
VRSTGYSTAPTKLASRLTTLVFSALPGVMIAAFDMAAVGGDSLWPWWFDLVGWSTGMALSWELLQQRNGLIIRYIAPSLPCFVSYGFLFIYAEVFARVRYVWMLHGSTVYITFFFKHITWTLYSI